MDAVRLAHCVPRFLSGRRFARLYFCLLFAYSLDGENMANHGANQRANTALAVLETALRERKLDRTLTTALPPLERSDPSAFIPFDLSAIDGILHGGLPRGQVSEIAGVPSSGRTTLLLRLIGAVTRRGEIAALIDTCDRLDVAAVSAAGIDADRLLWIRGESVDALSVSDRVIDRAVKALSLVLQAGGFALVAIDLADVPPRVLKSLPYTTWLRVQRIVEGSDTACLLIGPEPLARSAGGLTMLCTGHATWSAAGAREGEPGAAHARLTGLRTRVRVVSPRRRVDGEVNLRIDELTNLRIDESESRNDPFQSVNS
jgi:hypothetical protein